MSFIMTLGDTDWGRYTVHTGSGAEYDLKLEPVRSTVTRVRSGSEEPASPAQLRRDGESMRLMGIGLLERGRPASLWIDVLQDGHHSTLRTTTTVQNIIKHPAH